MCANLDDEEDGEQHESVEDSFDGSDEANPASDATTTPAASSCASPVKSKSRRKKHVSPVRHLPCADALVAQLRQAVGSEGLAGLGDPALRRLLQVHPAFSQLLAKSCEMRGIVERGAEAILDLGNAECSGRAVTARVLWTVCECVWRAISVVVGGSCGRLPAEAAPLDAQLRHLQQVNDDLRTRLTTCRRDYLRELTELRERCRQLEPPVAEALESLLREEPVMFFEPLDFVFDGATKDFIRDTVEEKLRLLMLKGWRKGDDDDDIGAMTQRIKELELEVESLRNELNTCNDCPVDEESQSGQADEESQSGQAEEQREEQEGFASQDVGEPDEEDGTDGEDGRQDDHFLELENELTVDSQCQATQTQDVWERRLGDPVIRKPAERRVRSSGATISGAAAGTNAGHGQPSGHGSVHRSPQDSDMRSEYHQLERKYRLLQRKFQRFIERLKGRVDEEVIEEALSHVGLERPRSAVVPKPRPANTAFDRLYADAQRRVQRIRDRTKEVHDMQVEELERCSGVVKGSGAKKKVEQLRGLHSKTVVCANAFHDALENFHFDVARTAIVEETSRGSSALGSSGNAEVAPSGSRSALQWTPVAPGQQAQPDSCFNSRGTSCVTSLNSSPQKPRSLDSSQMYALRSAFQNCGSQPDKMCKQASQDNFLAEAARHPRGERSLSAPKSMLSRSQQDVRRELYSQEAADVTDLPNELQDLVQTLKFDRFKFKASSSDAASANASAGNVVGAGVTAFPKSRQALGRSRQDLGNSRSLPSLPRYRNGGSANALGMSCRPSLGSVHSANSRGGARRSSTAAAVFGSTGRLVSDPRPWTTPSSSFYGL